MNLWKDVQFGLRSLLRSPGFTLLSVLILALGIGATTAIFTIFQGVLLEGLPYQDPSRLVRVYETFRSGSLGSVSVPNLRDWRTESKTLDFMAYQESSRNLQSTEVPVRLVVSTVEADHFDLLGVKPMLGRSFSQQEGQPGQGSVVLLSQWLWKNQFGGDRNVLGQTMRLDGRAYTIIGVMPAWFEFPPTSTERTGCWIPLEFPPSQVTARGSHSYGVVGRLRPGADLASAQTEMTGIGSRLEKLYPGPQTERSIRLLPLQADASRDVTQPLYLLIGAVALLFLIAGTNISNLLLARAMGRSQEVSVRSALGATRARLVRQFIVESLILSTAGALFGLALAAVSLDAILTLAADYIPRADAIHINLPVLAFLTALSLLVGLGAGTVPAWRAAQSDIGVALRESGGRGVAGGGANVRRLLVGSQIALAFLLLVGAGLLLRTLITLKNVAPGFATQQRMTMKLSISRDRFPGVAASQFFTRILDRVNTIPGVTRASMINLLPLAEWGNNGDFAIEGRPVHSPRDEAFAEFRVVSPGYFATMGIPILQGHDFTGQEPHGKLTAVVVSKKFADQYFPNHDALGHRLLLSDPPVEIIGVAQDTKFATLDRPAAAFVFSSLPQIDDPGSILEINLIVQGPLPPAALVDAVRNAIQQVDPSQPVFRVRSMEEVVNASVSDKNLIFWLICGFALLALTLSIAGVYGVISYLVSARTKEFGMRLALGASGDHLIGLVMKESLVIIGGGLALGILGALFLSRLMESLLYGVQPLDIPTFAVVAITIALASLIACYIPARRASRLDPMVALRHE